MTNTPESIPTFEQWMDTNPPMYALSDDEANHMSWRCVGEPHVKDPRNPIYQRDIEPDGPDTLKNNIPGLVSSRQEHAEKYRQDTPDAMWEMFRKGVKRIQEERETYNLPEPTEPTTQTGVEEVVSDLLN